jgi:phosphatidylethanolamine-binding protein (PEBP) family uncharacterized protein
MFRRLLMLFTFVVCAVALLAAPEETRKGGKGKGPKGQLTGAIDLVAAAKPSQKHPTFRLTSPAVKDGEKLPVEFTGDGASASPPLAWTGAPRGTQSYVLIMHHLDPEGRTKVYWVMHDIAPLTTGAAKNATDFGQMGVSTVHGRVEYAAPHSQGPGEKRYVLTLFALAAKPYLSKAERPVTFEPLLAAMKGKVLAAADLTVIYARPAGSGESESVRPPRK